ncbi:DUF6461 domain-containing protein [Nonomuraea typhae]|uniref:DUF6461 domain-containing protein n=1 Tax=Nonomuraea typhae TaxID=2603600 RepID=UPI0012FCBF68|nr:hypothetical protein [Nonomuraea typhae]
MTAELIDLYTRIVRQSLPEDVCWIVVKPRTGTLTVNDAVIRLGRTPEELEHMHTLDAAELAHMGETALSLDEAGDGVALFQIGGYAGLLPEVMEPLSRDARAWTVTWDVNADFTMLIWDDGAVTGGWNPYEPRETWATGLGPMAGHAPLFARYDLDDATQDPYYRHAVSLAVIERESGVRLDGAWIHREHPTLLDV